LIVYQASKSAFVHQVHTGDIDQIVELAFIEAMGRRVGKSEVQSWKASLESMAKVLNDDSIPDDVGVAIEYNIPQTGKRVDLILTGSDADRRDKFIIVELKQWETAGLSSKDGIVSTFVGGSVRECSHPSYQAWSYAALLEGFNEAVQKDEIALQPCAYLHNYIADSVISHDHYAPYIERAPLFLTGAAERKKLRDFINRHVKYGDTTNLLYRVENGRIRPSKMLADSLAKMLKGQPEFVLIDDQKVVYETALAMAKTASSERKKVLIVQGGPGTGKSVVALNLLSRLTKDAQNCRYVSKNAAPRAVFHAKLTGKFTATYIKNLFSSSGSFVEVERGSFNTLIVDEAHRLNDKSGLYGNLGNSQIKEIIAAADCSIFFVDEDQMVTLLDTGTKDEILARAIEAGAEILEVELASQFRCNGSDGYLEWLDSTLGIRPTANQMLDGNEFDFRVLNSPAELHELIVTRNKTANKARVVAGYCWDWKSKQDTSLMDIEFPEFAFSKRWNLAAQSNLWSIAPESVEEIGCIHTCQGLEVDYIGVIVGNDFVVRNGEVQCRPEARSKSDRSIRGWKRMVKESGDTAMARLSLIIKNTYRTLMTRGMKGCYIYCTDPETAEFFRSKLRAPAVLEQKLVASPVKLQEFLPDNVIPFRRVEGKALKPFKNAVPLVDLKFAAGAFSRFQSLDHSEMQWVALPAPFTPTPGYFVAQVIGESMNQRIPNGSWCLFRLEPKGTREGKVVVAQHRSIEDPDLGGAFTVKVYRSEKVAAERGDWTHSRIELRPDSDHPEFKPLIFSSDAALDLKIVAELISVIETYSP
jgi:DUF2075 family protein